MQSDRGLVDIDTPGPGCENQAVPNVGTRLVVYNDAMRDTEAGQAETLRWGQSCEPENKKAAKGESWVRAAGAAHCVTMPINKLRCCTHAATVASSHTTDIAPHSSQPDIQGPSTDCLAAHTAR